MSRRGSSPGAVLVALVAVAALLPACSTTPLAVEAPGASTVPATLPPGEPTVPTTTTTTTTTTTIPGATTTTAAPASTAPPGPPHGDRYVVPDGEVEREAKQLAADIAYDLTTYEQADAPAQRLAAIAGYGGVQALTGASEPLTHPGSWSRGEIVYPQLGGLTDEKTSVMVVTRQTVGTGDDPEFSVVRTLDIRLIKGETGWEFAELASAGGTFDTVEDLELAHAVAGDTRIGMPDSARLDILDGNVSPILLEVMQDIAARTPYSVTVMATGHPYHVFETDRVSHHTIGRAIDIHRVGDNLVIDDREDGSVTATLVQWLWENSDVIQVGSPWDVDEGPKRSFANTVHQDHIHLAVIGANDPRWVPAIGDLVWEDLNANGIRDTGEPGIGGVTVRLYDGAGSQLDSTLTEAGGSYTFRYLHYGGYRVEIDIPAGFVATFPDRGSDDTADSDIDASGVMAPTTLDPREHDPGWDAGLYRPASIGSLVWEDLDADGIQDEGEPGFADVTVRLVDGSGAELATTLTDGDGEYAFVDLTPGTYRLEIDLPDGYAASPQDQGPGAEDDEEFDSDIDADGITEATLLQSGENDRDWDAGLILAASIGDRVWEDLDGDGIQDEGEPGLGGITVRLLDADGNRLSSTVTGSDGSYLFEDLAAERYRIEIEIPDGYEAAPRDQGSDDAADSDINAKGITARTTLLPGEHDRRWDAGLVPV